MKGILKTYTYWKQCIALCLTLASFIFASAQNPIVTENALAGTSIDEWGIDPTVLPTIEGFATDISVNRGSTVHFKVKSSNVITWKMDIYRLGYYGGLGARKVTTTMTKLLTGSQPAPLENTALGLVDCGNWSENASWAVPANATPGVYIARVYINENNASHIPFIVRDDASTADILFQTSDATWQAYNGWGGNSLYTGVTSLPNGRASKVSYNRPFMTRSGGGGGGTMDYLFNAEYPMIRFMERNGYNMTYTTNVDMARSATQMTNHKIFLSVGHDEYWSKEQRDHVESALSAGKHLAFFSGNEVYWKTRWEPSISSGTQANRTLVCYKEGTLGEAVCVEGDCDPTNIWTGLWRDGCNSTNSTIDACKPENALTGQISWDNSLQIMRVPATYRDYRFWRNTTIATMGAESEAAFAPGTLGYEWDYERADYASSYPNGRITLSRSTYGGHTHKLSLYKKGSAWVFGAGTYNWPWGLDEVHDGTNPSGRMDGNDPVNKDMQQATINLFADMGVQPLTKMTTLVAALPSTDVTAPVTVITSPVNAGTVPSSVPFTISGTSSDNHLVAGVEISLDGGTTWKLVNGTTNWTYSYIPATAGALIIKVRGYDDSGNMEAAGTVPAGNAIGITVGGPPPPVCPCTIFKPTDVPLTTNNTDASPIELGVKFKSQLDGYITGVRFYKSTSDVGPHTGSLWQLEGGAPLAQAVFTAETASGWQEVSFTTPVAIDANATYIISYNSPTGFYATNEPYFLDSVDKYPLVAIASSDPNGPNGVYEYTDGTPTFPGSYGNRESNYWVDVVFNNDIGPDLVAPTVAQITPFTAATTVSLSGVVNITFSEKLTPATLNASTILLKNGGITVPTTLSYNVALRKITLTPSSPLVYSTEYTVTVVSGASGVKDLAGNPLAADFVSTFTTQDMPPPPPEDGPGGPILVISKTGTPFSRYAVEILRAEGLNEFAAADISTINAGVLNNYDVVVLSSMTLSPAEVTMFTDWTTAGGTLITFKPDAQLGSLLGITPAGGTLAEKYLLINTASGPGKGIVGETIQFHGEADLYTLSGATSIATLYSTSTTATTNPAISTRDVGPNGGKAIAFTFDLSKSIIYTRQGNPLWAGQKRDGAVPPIRSDDMFFGTGSEPNWVDFDKIVIPQADEQQRLLANIILQNNLHRKPLPRFWYLPRDLKAAIVLASDDHNGAGTKGRFEQHLTQGPNTPQDVADWKAVRATSYLYTGNPMTNDEATAFDLQGFEIGLHTFTNCAPWDPASLAQDFTDRLAELAEQYYTVPAPLSNRNHCVSWSDWATCAKLEALHNMRLDVNYYYWPETWTLNRPGLFTGSGLPMRFADLDGTIIDCYQAPTQMTDETNLPYTPFTEALLDKALGGEGYYGTFVANIHTDVAIAPGSDAIVAAAQARNVPLIAAKQLLKWLDGRNNSSFSAMTWTANQLSFTLTAYSGSHNLRAMLPVKGDAGLILASITRNGTSVPFTKQLIKGMEYGFFDGLTGNYVASYQVLPTATITGNVTWQGRPAAPNALWALPITVNLYLEGNPAPVDTYTIMTDQDGNFTIPNVLVDKYTISIKGDHTLMRVMAGQQLVAGSNIINFSTQKEGDVNKDNFVTGLDLAQLYASYNQTTGEPLFFANADLNGDGFVTSLDLGLLLSNYNTGGETP